MHFAATLFSLLAQPPIHSTNHAVKVFPSMSVLSSAGVNDEQVAAQDERGPRRDGAHHARRRRPVPDEEGGAEERVQAEEPLRGGQQARPGNAVWSGHPPVKPNRS